MASQAPNDVRMNWYLGDIKLLFEVRSGLPDTLCNQIAHIEFNDFV